MKILLVPPAAKFELQYRKKDGSIKTYTVSNPIEIDEQKITTYSFKRGIRSFRKDQIISFEQIL
jgi:hypothetical protein